MERRAEADLKELKSKILAMGGLVEQAIDKAIQAFLERNANKFQEVRDIEAKINKAHMDVDSTCLEMIATLSPVAQDLRLILAIVRINTDLERMGDQAMNICHNTEHYLGDRVEVTGELPEMAKRVRVMVARSLDAFVQNNMVLAKEVLASDDEVDAAKNKIISVMTDYMKQNPLKVEAALNLILIARNLERVADHATNIAEYVIFACSGFDVRHKSGEIPE